VSLVVLCAIYLSHNDFILAGDVKVAKSPVTAPIQGIRFDLRKHSRSSEITF
jgi:hypothetical protein